jgi:hypothetical protein
MQEGIAAYTNHIWRSLRRPRFTIALAHILAINCEHLSQPFRPK